MFKEGIKRTKPKIIIITPLIWPSKDAFLLKKDPTELAKAPNDTNTIENPITNCKAPLSLVIFEFFSNENIAKYPGTSGRTQGEKKESAPKKKAIDALISID